MTFKVQKTETTGIVYAEPNDPDQTVRVKHSAQIKSLGGINVTNQVTEIVVNDAHTVVVAGETSSLDAISIRVRVSGSLQATDRKKALLSALLTTLSNWADEDVLKGFNPSTVPVSVTP